MLDQPAFLNSAERKSKSNLLRLLVGCALSLVCLYFVFRHIKFAEVRQALATFRWPYLLLGFFSLSVGYTARIYRWKVLLRTCGSNVTTRACAGPFLASIALNNVLPLRLGDVVRAFVFPASLGVTRTAATATLVLERLADLLTLLICLAAAIFFFPKGALPSTVTDIVVIISVLGSATLLCLIFFTSPIVRLLGWITTRIENRKPSKLLKIVLTVTNLGRALEAISHPRSIFATFTISFATWAGELGLYLALMQGTGMVFSLPGGLLLMSMATIATLIPSSPGYVGPYHLAAFTAVNLIGGTSVQAMTLAVLCHLGVWLPTTTAGAIIMIFNRNLFKAVQTQAIRDEAGE
ncbi:lysylphosphatidylglycerol synthase transmembrane domain-containing protein [Dyella humi]|uniref:Flippase-like domain-containing protein n=1 Tax=Dyella humi TaxID=1770547 RepID=A0ABW8IKR3_9GAMM